MIPFVIPFAFLFFRITSAQTGAEDIRLLRLSTRRFSDNKSWTFGEVDQEISKLSSHPTRVNHGEAGL
jgi:hypothetical protein